MIRPSVSSPLHRPLRCSIVVMEFWNLDLTPSILLPTSATGCAGCVSPPLPLQSPPWMVTTHLAKSTSSMFSAVPPNSQHSFIPSEKKKKQGKNIFIPYITRNHNITMDPDLQLLMQRSFLFWVVWSGLVYNNNHFRRLGRRRSPHCDTCIGPRSLGPPAFLRGPWDRCGTGRLQVFWFSSLPLFENNDNNIIIIIGSSEQQHSFIVSNFTCITHTD